MLDRGSFERIIAGKEIPRINTLVDLYNYFSIRNIIPIGGEDLDQLCGDVKLTLANGSESFRAIGSENRTSGRGRGGL